jgi:hypothetical protein
MARRTVNGYPLTVAEAIFLATSGSLNIRPGGSNYVTTDDVREIVRVLDNTKSRDLNLDTARTRAHDALEFRESGTSLPTRHTR